MEDIDLKKELESLKDRVRTLEVIAGVEQSPREKVRTLGHDSTKEE